MTAPEIDPEQAVEIYHAGWRACERRMAPQVTQAFDIGESVGRSRAEREQASGQSSDDRWNRYWEGYNQGAKDMTDPVIPHRHTYRLTRPRRTRRLGGAR